MLSVIALAMTLILNSCEKENGVSLVSVDPSDPETIDVYSEKTYSQLEFVNFVGESFDDYLSDFLSERLNLAVKQMILSIFQSNSGAVRSVVAQELGTSELLAATKWGVKVYNFTYVTLSYTGKPIKLSAALCVPVILDGTTHDLSAISLCLPHMPIEKEFCATVNGSILMARLAFNHAVVVPDYQGRGVTASGPYSSLHTHDHAVQAIHAALAARTILEQKGFDLKGVPLYNVGVSEGGEVAYDTQKLIENDITQTQRNALNLKLTFSANGIAQHSKYIATQMGIYEYTGEQSFIDQMEFYADAFDCLSASEKQGHTGAELYSHDLLDKDNKIILDHPMIKLLQAGVERNDISYNWNPSHPLTLAASHDDNDVLYDDNALYMYNLLKNTPDGKTNTKVKLLDFNTPISAKVSDFLGPDMMFAHVAADICCFIHAIRYEDPGSAPIVTTIFNGE